MGSSCLVNNPFPSLLRVILLLSGGRFSGEWVEAHCCGFLISYDAFDEKSVTGASQSMEGLNLYWSLFDCPVDFKSVRFQWSLFKAFKPGF